MKKLILRCNAVWQDIKLTTEEQLVSCCILNTSEYCLEMTEKFEEKMKELVLVGKLTNYNIVPTLFQNGVKNCVLRCVLHPSTLRCWVQNTSPIQNKTT